MTSPPRCVDCAHDHYRTGEADSCTNPDRSIRFLSWMAMLFLGRRHPQDPPCPGFTPKEAPND